MDGGKVYLDASVVLRRMLRQQGAMEGWSDWELAVTSEIMQLEVLRTLDRLRLGGKASEKERADCQAELRVYASRCQVIPIHSGILRRAAGPFPAPLGALDAIHLASALIWMEVNSEDLTFLTHDQGLAVCARACGVVVKG